MVEFCGQLNRKQARELKSFLVTGREEEESTGTSGRSQAAAHLFSVCPYVASQWRQGIMWKFLDIQSHPFLWLLKIPANHLLRYFTADLERYAQTFDILSQVRFNTPCRVNRARS